MDKRCLYASPMQQVTLHNLNRPGSQPVTARYCASYLCQLRGLMFRRRVPVGWGLLLAQGSDSRMASAIHMLFMFTDLAVAWINTAGEVVDVRLARRWRLAYVPSRPARYVLEMDPVHLNDFHAGDHIQFEPLLPVQ